MSTSGKLVWTAGLIAALVPAGFAQDEGNTLPTIEIIQWVVTRDGASTIWYDRDGAIGTLERISTDRHQELDDVTVTIEVLDADWVGDESDQNEQDEEIFLRLTAEGVLFGFEIGRPGLGEITPPQPPPFADDEVSDEFFGATEDEGFRPEGDPLRVVYTFRFQVPEFLGKNQLRLRGIINFDVAWILRFWASNEKQVDDDSSLNRAAVTLLALENPSLGPPNPQAFADAGADRTVPVNTIVVLDGSRTFETFNIGFDPDDDRNIFEKDILSFTWEWVSGPTRVDPEPEEPGNPRNPRATVMFDEDETGVYVYRLLVDDNVNALPSTDSVTITVVYSLPARNAPVAVIAGPANAVPVGAIVTLYGDEDPQGNTLSFDPDGDDLTYRWQQTNELGGPLAPEELQTAFQPLTGLDQPQSSWQALTPGIFFFRLLVDDGSFRSSATFSVEVVATATGGASDELTFSSPSGDQGDSRETTPMFCGSGLLLPLAVVPLALSVMRRRIR